MIRNRNFVPLPWCPEMNSHFWRITSYWTARRLLVLVLVLGALLPIGHNNNWLEEQPINLDTFETRIWIAWTEKGLNHKARQPGINFHSAGKKVFESYCNGGMFTFCFPSFLYGKRFRKHYQRWKQIDTSLEHVEIVSLCAYLKAYFDLFRPYFCTKNYEVTPLYQLCRWVDLFNVRILRIFLNDEDLNLSLSLEDVVHWRPRYCKRSSTISPRFLRWLAHNRSWQPAGLECKRPCVY